MLFLTIARIELIDTFAVPAGCSACSILTLSDTAQTVTAQICMGAASDWDTIVSSVSSGAAVLLMPVWTTFTSQISISDMGP